MNALSLARNDALPSPRNLPLVARRARDWAARQQVAVWPVPVAVVVQFGPAVAVFPSPRAEAELFLPRAVAVLPSPLRALAELFRPRAVAVLPSP